jgi:hypothetical protein
MRRSTVLRLPLQSGFPVATLVNYGHKKFITFGPGSVSPSSVVTKARRPIFKAGQENTNFLIFIKLYYVVKLVCFSLSKDTTYYKLVGFFTASYFHAGPVFDTSVV